MILTYVLRPAGQKLLQTTPTENTKKVPLGLRSQTLPNFTCSKQPLSNLRLGWGLLFVTQSLQHKAVHQSRVAHPFWWDGFCSATVGSASLDWREHEVV